MTVLVVGPGAREHALAWRLAGSESVERVIVAPGNAGIARDPRIRCIDTRVSGRSIGEWGIDLAIVGPEGPLTEGLADELRGAGALVVGPGAEAARLEGSKTFAKEFMRDHGIRTAEFKRCVTPEEARSAVTEFGVPVVIKADGLAAGKGVSVCESETQAYAAIETIMNERLFGDAGETVVVERYLSGFEVSMIVLVDEHTHLVLPTAEDHKQIGDGGVGVNTPGMGAVSPNPRITPELAARIEEEIVVPSVRGVQRQGWTFRGFLFIGLMVDRDGPRVLEYNVRFGDPEAQAILTVVSGDLGVLFRGLAAGRLAEAIRESNYGVRDGVSCAVVAAPGGYPGPYTTGDEITIEPVPPSSELAGSTELFFSGVSSVEGALGAPREQPGRRMKTSGGRVLTAVAFGRSLDEARRRAYARLQLVGFSGMRVRSDIGGPAILSTVVEESDVLMPQFRKRGGLVPVVVQDAGSGDVLMVAYANAGAVRTTLETGYATFWSTSRSEEWTKGATSGNRLRIMEVRIDCDQDALLYRVELEGRGVCHTRSAAGGPRRRCFYRRVEPDGSLAAEE